jgi:hypothetical protein
MPSQARPYPQRQVRVARRGQSTTERADVTHLNVLTSSYGPFLLGVVAAGLIGFALYSIADARYAKI